MIVVAGEALVDVIARPDGAVVVVPGGGPYNTARAIGRLGVPVAFAGAPVDRRARGVEARSLAADGVSLDLVQRTDLPTTRAFAELDEGGEAQYRFDVVGTSAPALDADALLAALPPDVVARARRDPGSRVRADREHHRDRWWRASADDVVLMVDPNCRPSAIGDPAAYRARLGRILARADVVKVSAADGPRVPGHPTSTAPVRRRDRRASGPSACASARRDARGRGPGRGGRGLGRGGGHLRRRDARVARPRRRAAGRRGGSGGILPAVRFGLRAASLVVQRPGADPPTLAELGGW